MNFNFSIKVPLFLGQFFLWIYLQYKKFRYGFKFRYILLNHGRFAIVDSADYEKLMQYKWSIKISPEYVMRSEKGKTVYMHNQIMQPPTGLIVDHIDHKGLNNARSNLRIATKSQNVCNNKKTRKSSSKYKGVYYSKALRKWGAAIGYKGKGTFLGYFANEIDAARAYDKAAKELHKDFAVLNFPS